MGGSAIPAVPRPHGGRADEVGLFEGCYGFADGSGGVAIIEVDDVVALAWTTAPWTPWLRFGATPILPIEESAAIGGEGVAFRDSVS